MHSYSFTIPLKGLDLNSCYPSGWYCLADFGGIISNNLFHNQNPPPERPVVHIPTGKLVLRSMAKY